MKFCDFTAIHKQIVVAPPRGERGLKLKLRGGHFVAPPVAPPRGERGLKYCGRIYAGCRYSRSPSWGAWIEINTPKYTVFGGFRVAPPRGERGLKFIVPSNRKIHSLVAPPRGERGLKLMYARARSVSRRGRSPSWGAWIEMYRIFFSLQIHLSLPLVGSVD